MYRSSANAFQAAEAAVIGPAPGPAYISPELISGGNIANSIIYAPPHVCASTAGAASDT